MTSVYQGNSNAALLGTNLRYQQNLATITFSIIVLIVPDNRLPTIQPLMPQVQLLLDTITPGSIVEIPPLPYNATTNYEPPTTDN